MGKTPSPGKWIKSLLGKKSSSKSSLEKGNDKLRSAKKEEIVVKVKDTTNVSDLPTNPPVLVPSQDVAASTQAVTVVPEKHQPSEEEESNVNLESGDELKLEEAATKVQAAVRSHQAREEFQKLRGIIKLQALIRGRLVRRQAVATYSCIWGVVKLQALVRGNKARSSETVLVQLQKTKSETMQGSRYKWLENPTKLSMIDKLLVSSPTSLPLKIQYGPEDPNSAKVWLERWTVLQVWSPGPLVVKSPVARSQTKKRSFQAVEADKGKQLKKGIKKPPGGGLTTGSSSSGRSTAEKEKPKTNVRKASTLGKEVSRTENDKTKQNSRKSTSAVKEGSSSLEVKDEKPRVSLKKATLSNGLEKPTRKSAEKKKEIADTVPGDKVSAPVVDTPEEEKVKDSPETVSKEADLDKDEQDEVKTAEGNDKAEEEIQEPDVQISSENGNAGSENTKPSDRRASLPAKIETHHQEDGLTTHSGRKIPSYMAPTASAKARVRGGGQGSPRIIGQEKPEKNGITRRHSLPPGANGKLSTMSPRAHRLLIASAKGSMNSDRSFSSSKDIGDKSTKAEWKR
ncbi:protein IQ-DOMAIN 29 isoform X2 [Raphanus sativus]|uniref:Protein IQ-DOMAIN 29 isoform X2 n=1 Tax=Raphanus sativus TaxID=3726 RepID=A0A9W3C0K4_RAPSA|nr:protein IQ-DOMAIN 29 isoform X2 [Raphanus sativus]